MLRAHRDHRASLLENLCCQSPPTMASDVESSGEKIVPDVGIHHVWKILSASGSDRDITASPQDITQVVLGCETAKNVPGADEQNAMHVDQQIKYTEAYGSGKENYGVVKFIPSTTRQDRK